KPWAARIVQTTEAERGLSLGTAQLEWLHRGAALEAALDFAHGGALEPKFHGFGQHGVRLLAGLALAGNTQLRTARDEPSLVLFHHRRESRHRDDFTVFVNPTRFHGVSVPKPGRVGNH